LFSALLAGLVAVSLSLSAVQSHNIAVKMAVSGDMEKMVSEGCDGCPGGADGVASGCTSICMVTVFATLPVSVNLERTIQADRFEVFPTTPRDGPVSSKSNPPKYRNFS